MQFWNTCHGLGLVRMMSVFDSVQEVNHGETNEAGIAAIAGRSEAIG